MDGKALAGRMLDRVAQITRDFQAVTDTQPCLATVLVGSDAASVTYTNMKRKRAEAVGMKSIKLELPEDTSTQQLVDAVGKLGQDPAVHGILLQHPVPKQIDERQGFEAIPAAKDVDGVTIQSFGHVTFGDVPGYGSCTPAGIMTLLRAYNFPLEGSHAVVIGRSPILGKPMAMMLLAANSTVTICHSRTRDLPDIVRQADIVVAAVGKPQFVQGDWIKPGAVVMDAGYNEGNVGDVDYDACAQKAGMITPVPGGVGPMTIATLIANTAHAAAVQLGQPLPQDWLNPALSPNT